MAQRKEMQEDLDDTIKDHIYEMQISGLDDMMDNFSKQLDEWKTDIHTDSEARKQLLEEIRDGLVGNSSKISDSSIAGLLNLTSNTANSTNSKVTVTDSKVDELLNRTSETLGQEGDKVDNHIGNTEVLESTGIEPTPLTGNAEKNTVAEEAIKAETPPPAPKPSSNPSAKNAQSSSTAKQTVTDAQALKAYNYILKSLKYSSSQNSKWGTFNTKLWTKSNRKVYLPGTNAKKAWQLLGSPGVFSSQNLLDVSKKTGIWNLLKQVSTDSKGHISYPMMAALANGKSAEIHGYAKGGIVNKSGRYLTDEKGEEIIITKQGILRPLSAGTSVIPADITERLYAIASNYDMGANTKVHSIDASKLTRIGGDTISPIINCPITIEGNANEQDVINAINKAMPKISKHVQNDIRKDLRKSGR